MLYGGTEFIQFLATSNHPSANPKQQRRISYSFYTHFCILIFLQTYLYYFLFLLFYTTFFFNWYIFKLFLILIISIYFIIYYFYLFILILTFLYCTFYTSFYTHFLNEIQQFFMIVVKKQFLYTKTAHYLIHAAYYCT